MELNEAIKKAKELREFFALLEQKRYGRGWTTSEIALGFVGDVGDLAKLVQSAAGVRNTSDLKSNLEHELSDCLWSILVLADELDIDIESAFKRTIEELGRDVRGELEA